MGRAPCCDKANVKRGPWSPEEDARLKAFIEENGISSNWIALPQKIGLKRCGKSCRLRWLNYLRPNLKHGGFSEEEDSIICSLYISIGSRWSIIAAQLPGRTDNDIKNYWNTKLKKRLLGSNKAQSKYHCLSSNKNDDHLANEKRSQDLNSSALERIQLHMQVQGIHCSFSSYNNPLLWPTFHPLASTIPRQDDSNTTVTEPIRETNLTTELQDPNFITANIQEFNNSVASPNRSNLDLDSATTFLHVELHELPYSENGCLVGWEDQRHAFKDFDWEQGTTSNWCLNYCFEDKPNPESWDPSIQLNV